MVSSEAIKVLTRVRPSAQAARSNCITIVGEKQIDIGLSDPKKHYEFDGVLGSNATQRDVFEAFRHIISGIIDGVNGTLFAYGQTGSGKTFTMLGPMDANGMLTGDAVLKGLIPRAAELIFSELAKKARENSEMFSFECEAYFVELFNDNIFDLLEEGGPQTIMKTRLINAHQSIVEGVKKVRCESAADLLKVVTDGWGNRRVAETAMNRESSRSHAMLIVELKTEHVDMGVVRSTTARLNLVDLAGSERQSQAKTAGDRLKEASNINQSLSVLGRVIRQLAKDPTKHIPYRDSRLTMLLRESLGGNARTAVCVNLHPDIQFCAESESTLRFAQNCKEISNTIVFNEDVSGESVQALKAEILRLRSDAREEFQQQKLADQREMAVLREQLDQSRAQNAQKDAMLCELRGCLMVRSELVRGRIDPADLESVDARLHSMMPIIVSERPAAGMDMKIKIDQTNVTMRSAKKMKRRKSLEDLEFELEEEKCAHMETSRRLADANARLADRNSQLASPMRRLSMGAPLPGGAADAVPMTPAEKKKAHKKRRETMYTPADGRRSVMFRPVGRLLEFDEAPQQEEADEHTPSNNVVDDAEKEMEEMHRMEQELLDKTVEVDQLNQIMAAREESILDLGARNKTLVEENRELRGEVAKAAEAEASLRAALDSAKQQLETMEGHLADKAASIQQTEQALEKAQADVGEMAEELARWQAEVEVKEKMLDEMHAIHKDELAAAEMRHKKELGSGTAVTRRLEAELDALNNEITTLKITNEETLKMLELVHQSSRVANVEKATAQAEASRFKGLLEGAEMERDEMRERCERIEPELARLSELVDEKERELQAELDRHADKENEQAAAIESHTREKSSFERKIAEFQAEIGDKDASVRRLEEELSKVSDDMVRTLHDFARTRKELEEWKEEVRKKEGEISALAGHQNQNQKIMLVQKLQEEKRALRKKVAQMEEMMTKYGHAMGSLGADEDRENHSPPTSSAGVRVTRSRAARN